MKWSLRQWAIAIFVAFGAWHVGSGIYIYAKALLAQRLIAEAWTRTLAGEQQARPWPWADTWPIARLQVEKEKIDLYVLSDATGRTLAFGPGLLSGTAMPGGQGGTVISAHRDTHFRFLRDVSKGTEIALQTSDSRWHAYRMVDSTILDVRKDRLEVDQEHSTLILMTCYPFDAIVPGGPLRYAVIAEPIAEGAVVSASAKF